MVDFEPRKKVDFGGGDFLEKASEKGPLKV